MTFLTLIVKIDRKDAYDWAKLVTRCMVVMALSTPFWGEGYQNTQIHKVGPKYPRDMLLTKPCVEICQWESSVLMSRHWESSSQQGIRHATGRGATPDTHHSDA